MKTATKSLFFAGLSLVAAMLVTLSAAFAQTSYELETEMNQWIQARRVDPQSYEAAWNLSRVLIGLGNHQEKDKERKPFYVRAVKIARTAVELSPDDTWGHHYLAAALGKQILTEGGKTKIELSKEVRLEALKAIACDPNNDRSHHILGRWNREIANLGSFQKLAAKVAYGGVPQDASNEKAVEHFMEAIRLNPNSGMHHLELGKTYLKMCKYDKAIEEFEITLMLPNHNPNDSESKTEARTMLRDCKDKTDQGVEHWEFEN